jgi:hypothetical protein
MAKHLPRVMRLYGRANFELRGSRVFAFGREIVHTEKRRKEILDDNMERFGGGQKLYSRLNTSFLGISRSDVVSRHRKEERRQLKAEPQVPAGKRTFIVAARPGYFQMDLTFYHGAKIVVFGIVDVFSRWCYYEIIKRKTPKAVLHVLEKAFAAFKTVAPHHKIYKVQADSGGEFKGAVKTFLDAYNEGGELIAQGARKGELKHKLLYRQVAQPQRLIESLNGTLRQHVERVDWGRKAELVRIIREFVLDYNNSVHTSTRERPNDLVILRDDELKREHKRQMARGRESVKGVKTRGVRELKIGALVRMYRFPSKKAIGHRGTKPHWTKTIYVVKRIVKSTRGASRYKLERRDGNAVAGMFFRDRLLEIEEPTIKAKGPKYDPGGEGDFKEEAVGEEDLDAKLEEPDAPPKTGWSKKKVQKSKYAGAEDIRASSEDEADEPVRQAIAQEKAVPKRAVPKRKVNVPKKEVLTLQNLKPGAKVFVYYEGKPFLDEAGIVLATFRTYAIVLFEKDDEVLNYKMNSKEIYKLAEDVVPPARVKELLDEYSIEVGLQKTILADS